MAVLLSGTTRVPEFGADLQRPQPLAEAQAGDASPRFPEPQLPPLGPGNHVAPPRRFGRALAGPLPDKSQRCPRPRSQSQP